MHNDTHLDVYDYHEHDDHIHRTTGYAHIHDRHPYHHHDRRGSVLYLDDGVTAGDDGLTVYPLKHVPTPIGCGGSDIDRRTSTPTRR